MVATIAITTAAYISYELTHERITTAIENLADRYMIDLDKFDEIFELDDDIETGPRGRAIQSGFLLFADNERPKIMLLLTSNEISDETFKNIFMILTNRWQKLSIKEHGIWFDKGSG